MKKKKKKEEAQTVKKEEEEEEKRSSSSGGQKLDYTKMRDVLRLLTEEVCFGRTLKRGDRCGISNNVREIVPDCSGLK